MTFIKGDIRILYIKRSSDLDFIKVCYLLSNPIDEDVEMLPTTTRVANGWKTSIPTTQSITVGFEGIQMVTAEGEFLSYDSLKITKRTRERVEWKIEDDSGNFIDTGFGHIRNISESNQVGEFLGFSGEIEGYGEPTFTRDDGDIFMNGQTMLFQDGQTMIFN